MLDKNKERVRLDKLGKILSEAKSELEDAPEYCDYDYKVKLHEMEKTIGSKIIEEPERVEKFRRGLYARLAVALVIVFGGMALVSGLFGAIKLIVCIDRGIVNALGALAWALVTIGLTFAAIIAMAAADAM